MFTRSASAEWNGGLKDGNGSIALGSKAWSGPYSFRSRFGDDPHANPEELVGAAHAGCFSMALAAALSEAGHSPKRVATTAKVRLVKDEAGGGFVIDQIALTTEAEIPNIAAADFEKIAQQAKANCPVSKALAGPNITLDAKLVG